MSRFSDWSENKEDLEMFFPATKDRTAMTFEEWLWRETRDRIRNLPEISYTELPDLLE